MRWPEADTGVRAGRRPVMVVTLRAPGFTLRAASESVSIDDDRGDGPYMADARLVRVDDVDPEVDAFGLEGASPARVRVGLILREDISGPGALEMAWHHLTASRVEVAALWTGQGWKDRRVWVSEGIVSNLELGTAGEPTSFTAESLAPKLGPAIGDASRDMGLDFPSLGYTSLDGKEWPTVIGACQKIPAFKLGIISGTDKALGLAGHAFASTTAPTIYEDGVAYTPTGTVTVTNTTDTAGKPVCYLRSNNTADFTDVQGAFTVDATAGGVTAVEGTGAAINADGALAYLLGQVSLSGQRVDFARMRSTIELLRSRKVSVYVDRSTDALRVIRERLLPHLPLLEEMGEGGLWYRYTDPFTAVPELDLVVGANLVGRVGPIVQVTDDDDIANRLTIEFDYDHYLGRYVQSVTIDATNSPACAMSKRLHGERMEATRTCNITADSATAAWFGHLRMNRTALHRFAATYVADPSLYGVESGTIAQITDPDLGIELRRCIVRKTTPQLDPLTFTVEFVPALSTSVGV